MASTRFTGDPDEVSARMRAIQSENTKPELRFFKILESAGIGFVRHPVVEGVKPDALIGEWVVVFVDSSFWHLRVPADLDRLNDSWRLKLLGNRARDRRQTRALRVAGYTVVRIWDDELEATSVIRRVRRATTLSERRHEG